jgi:hypothetical protein
VHQFFDLNAKGGFPVRFLRPLALAFLLGVGVVSLGVGVVSTLSSAVDAQVIIDTEVAFPPPPLPIYEQPPIPAPGYFWTPGYWAWYGGDYYWVPGTWVLAPRPGLLWTPGYWSWNDGVYGFHTGYWASRVGFYGGVVYGFGYTGAGYEGGYWNNGNFFYNSAVNNVVNVNITNVYTKTVIVNNTINNVSYNGGAGGTMARPRPEELEVAREQHIAATPSQVQHAEAASKDRSLFASTNHGAPPVGATASPGVFKGAGVVPAKAAGSAQPPQLPGVLPATRLPAGHELPGAAGKPLPGPSQKPVTPTGQPGAVPSTRLPTGQAPPGANGKPLPGAPQNPPGAPPRNTPPAAHALPSGQDLPPVPSGNGAQKDAKPAGVLPPGQQPLNKRPTGQLPPQNRLAPSGANGRPVVTGPGPAIMPKPQQPQQRPPQQFQQGRQPQPAFQQPRAPQQFQQQRQPHPAFEQPHAPQQVQQPRQPPPPKQQSGCGLPGLPPCR